MIRFSFMMSILLAASLLASPGQTSLPPMGPPPDQINEIVVQNRILTTVNGKNISVLDLVKQMDVFLSRYYPQYMNSKTARYQFYTTQWRQTLQQMVDHQLMMADAESREVKVSDGEVREEVQARFGPNVMSKLDTLGLTYDEARELVQQDMIVQRIHWLRITSKALQKVTSQDIKDAYQKYLAENPAKEEWKYQFVTIRSADEQTSRDLALQLSEFKEKAEKNLSVAADLFKAQLPADSTATLSVSQEFDLEDKSLSTAHREVLAQMKPGEWSQPTVQVSRDGTAVVRIFHLKDHTKSNPPAFAAVANNLKQSLLNETAETEMKTYLAKLRQRFNRDEKSLDIPSGFEPFAVR